MAELHEPGRLRVLAVADPGGEVARWYPNPEAEVLDPDEEVIVVATRDGPATLLEHGTGAPRGALADLVVAAVPP